MGGWQWGSLQHRDRWSGPALRAVKCVQALVLLISVATAAQALQVDLKVPEFPAKGEEAYLCTTVELPAGPHKLVAIEPLADEKTVHHMLLFGKYSQFLNRICCVSLKL